MVPPPHPLAYVDFYHDKESGGLGVAWVALPDSYMSAVDPDPAPGAMNFLPIEEYLETHFGKGKLEEREIGRYFGDLGFVRPDDSPWPLPDKPETSVKEWEVSSESGSLLNDVARFFSEHVRLPAEAPARAVAAWVLRSAVPETATHAPPLAFLGPPRSGKSRGVRALRLVARRAMYLGVPSPASLYALTHLFQPTLLIDEWSKLAPDIRRAVEAVLRMGFDRGGYIPRRKDHSDGVKFWRAFSYFGLASQEPLADDLMDRAIPIFMTEHHGVPDLALDNREAMELRTMVLRYRLEVLAGTCHRLPAPDGRGLVTEDLRSRRGGSTLSDRGLDKAQVLAAIASPFDAVDDVVDTMLMAERAGKAQYSESVEAVVFRAIERLTHGAVPTIEGFPRVTLREIHDEAWRELMDDQGYTQRQLEMHDPVLPEKLGPLVRTMGFLVVRRKDGRIIQDPEIREKLRGLQDKYGGDV